MRNSTLNWAMSAALALSVAGGALAASGSLNPSPNRDSKLIAGFETSDLNGWTSDRMKTGTSLAAQSTDPATVAEGKASLKVDLTSFTSGWTEPAIEAMLAPPIDITGYGTFSMDVYAPAASMAASGGWYQPNLRITDSKMVTTYYGNRDLHPGWNHLSWKLNPSVTSIARIFFAMGYSSSAPFIGPIYLDNVRVWKGQLTGMHPDETLIDGWDNASEASNLTPTGSLTADINTDKAFIQAGAGSLKLDMTGQMAYAYPILTAAFPPVDLSKAIALRVDVYAPTASLPANKSWWQLGFGIKGDGGTVQGPPEALLADQWDTLEIALSPDDAAKLTNASAMVVGTNSGDIWSGPVYFDNLRAVIPSALLLGNPTGSGKVGIADATLVLQYVVKLKTPTTDQATASDVDKDGDISIKDVTKILQAIVNGTAF